MVVVYSMQGVDMDKLKANAIRLGAEELGVSRDKSKAYYVIVKRDDGKTKRINFGQPGASTYLQNGDEGKRKAFRARMSKIKRKNGPPAYMDKHSALYWSWNLLW